MLARKNPVLIMADRYVRTFTKVSRRLLFPTDEIAPMSRWANHYYISHAHEGKNLS